jgi:hypothetical protein
MISVKIIAYFITTINKMENNSIMNKFNSYNDLSQELTFLNAKYSWLLKLNGKEKERFKDLLAKNNLMDEVDSQSIDIEKINSI